MSKVRSEKLLALSVFSVAAIILTFPVPLHLGSLVIGRPFEDTFESIWYLYWYKHALFDLHTSPLFQTDIFYPIGWDLRFSILPPLYPIVLSPLTLLTSPVIAYNLTIIGSSVFAAYGMFLAVRAAGGNVWGGLLAGVTFAFYPQREVYFGGHLNFLLGSMWLPWIVYGALRATQSAQRRIQWVVLTFLSYALAVAGAWQFVFIGGATFLITVAGYWLTAIWRHSEKWSWPLVAGLLAWGIITVPLLWGGIAVQSQIGPSARFTLEEVDSTSVSLERFLVPSAINPLVWKLARETFPLVNGQDSVVILGYVPLFLAWLQLWGNRHSLDAHHKVAFAMFVSGSLLMLGPTLHFWGKSIMVPMPLNVTSMLKDATQAIGFPQLVFEYAVRIPAPAMFIYWLVPPSQSFHHFGRWGLMVSTGVAMLAGLGLTKVTRGLRLSLRPVVGGLALLLLMIEFNTQPIPAMISTGQMHRAVDDWLAARPERNVIIEYPLWYAMKGQSLYYTMMHGQKIVHGYSSILPASYSETLTVLNQWPEPAALDLLERIGVKYILVHAFQGDDFENKQLPVLLSISRLKLIEVFPTPIGIVRQIYLFELQR